jgi:hypothetical protein
MSEVDDMIPTERIFAIALEFAAGRRMTPRQIADRYGLTPDGAYKMLLKASRISPLIEDQGVWWLHHNELP